jgi:hypothetical protein
MDDSEGRAGTSWRHEATSCGYGGEGRIGTTGMCDATKWRGNKKATKCWCRWGLEGGGRIFPILATSEGGLGGGHKNRELFRRVVGEAFLIISINFNLSTFFGELLETLLDPQI